MTRKMTVADAVERVSSFTSGTAIKMVLMDCTRATMLEVLRILTNGEKHVFQASTIAETAERVTNAIQDWRKTEEYRALPFEEKYADLMKADIDRQSWCVDRMRLAELKKTARRLGVTVREGYDAGYTRFYLMKYILNELETIRQVSEVEGTDWHYDVEGLCGKLRMATHRTLSILVEKAGLEVEVRESYFNTEAKEALLKYYTTEEHTEAYEPEDWEESYSDYAGDNTHPEQDIPALRIRVKKAVSPKPRNTSCYDFSLCKDEKVLRKVLNAAKVETLEQIARAVKGFQPRTDGKRMTKKYYVDAIVGLYSPQEQDKPAPVKEVEQEHSYYCFEVGKIYVKDAVDARRKPRLFKVIKRSKKAVTVQEINPYDFTEYISVPISRPIKHARWIASEYISTTHGYCKIYARGEYSLVFPEDSPDCDVEFNETAYSPDYEANPAVLDDVPGNEYPGHSPTLTVEDRAKGLCRNYYTVEAMCNYRKMMLRRTRELQDIAAQT